MQSSLRCAAENPQKIKSRINRFFGKAICDYRMISEGDHILVAVSGGKDSLCLWNFLLELRKKAPVSFTITAAHLVQGAADELPRALERQFLEWQVPYVFIQGNTRKIVVEKLSAGAIFKFFKFWFK